MPTFKRGTIELMETYLLQNNMDKAVKLVKQATDSNYLSQQNLEVIYSYHPDLKKAISP